MGSEWKEHKYIRKEDGKYIYDEKQNDIKYKKENAKNNSAQREKETQNYYKQASNTKKISQDENKVNKIFEKRKPYKQNVYREYNRKYKEGVFNDYLKKYGKRRKKEDKVSTENLKNYKNPRSYDAYKKEIDIKLDALKKYGPKYKRENAKAESTINNTKTKWYNSLKSKMNYAKADVVGTAKKVKKKISNTAKQTKERFKKILKLK